MLNFLLFYYNKYRPNLSKIKINVGIQYINIYYNIL